MREIRTLRSMWRGLETWHGRDSVTLANERARNREYKLRASGPPRSPDDCRDNAFGRRPDLRSQFLLTLVPVINVLTNLIFCETVPLLNLAFELVPTTIYDVKVVVSKLSPFFLDLTFDLLPISFHSIPVHVNLRR